MEKSIAFYRNVLGLESVHESPYWSEFVVGSNSIGLHPPIDGAQPPYGRYPMGWYLGLQVDDIRALRRRLEDEGVKIERDYHDIPGGVILDFSDPDGHILEAFQSGTTVSQLTS